MGWPYLQGISSFSLTWQPERIDPPPSLTMISELMCGAWASHWLVGAAVLGLGGKAGISYLLFQQCLSPSQVELATGQFPYKNCKTDFEVLTKVLQEEPPLLPGHMGFSGDFQSFVKDW